MKRGQALLLCLQFSLAAAQGTLSLDPLPEGTIQLAYNQYLIRDVGGFNVLLFSDHALNLTLPGQTLTPKVTLNLAAPPANAMRLNSVQYMIPAVMPGVTALVVLANTPLSAPLSLAQFTAAPVPTPAAPPTPSPSAPPVAVTPARPINRPPVVPPRAPRAARDAPSATLALGGTGHAGSTTLPSVPLVAPAPTPAPKPPKPLLATTAVPTPAPPAPPAPIPAPPAPSAPTPVPTPTLTPSAPATPSPAVTPAPTPTPAPVSPSLTTEDRGTVRLPRFPGLPDDLSGSIVSTERAGTVTFSYTLTSLGSATYTLNPAGLRLTQDGVGVRARLSRRNGTLTPGLITPNSGEIGSVIVNRRTNAALTLNWVITDQAGHAYTLTATHHTPLGNGR